MTCPACGATQNGEPSACPRCGEPQDVAVLEFVDRDDPAHRLRARDYLIGRAAESDISILHTSVSRRHARLVWEDGGFVVEDLGSRLGVFVEETPAQRERLTSGATLRLGEVRLRYARLPARGAAAQAPTMGGGTLAGEQGAELLQSIVAALDSALTLEEVLHRILEAVMKISGAERGFALLEAEDGGGDMQVRASRGRPGTPLPDASGISRTVLAEMRRLGGSVVTGNATDEPALKASDSLITGPRRTVVCLPLQSARESDGGRRLVGALYLDNQAQSAPFHPERIRAMEGLARHAGLALEIARLFEREEQRIRELQQARDQALEASRAKGSFLANMTHELLTPLNAIINYAEMVQDRAQEIGEDDMAGDAEKIRTSGRHLLRIVDDVLDMTRLQDASTLKREPVELSWLVSDLVEKARPRAEKNGNTLELRVPDELGAAVLDARRLRQALDHVVSNAARFTRDGNVVVEAWREAAPGGDRVHFVITDTGIGIPAEQLARLFEPFSQGDASITRRYEGAGLGLAVTRRICEALGGSIDVQSTPGAGSRFHLDIPVGPAAPASGSAAGPAVDD